MFSPLYLSQVIKYHSLNTFKFQNCQSTYSQNFCISLSLKLSPKHRSFDNYSKLLYSSISLRYFCISRLVYYTKRIQRSKYVVSKAELSRKETKRLISLVVSSRDLLVKNVQYSSSEKTLRIVLNPSIMFPAFEEFYHFLGKVPTEQPEEFILRIRQEKGVLLNNLFKILQRRKSKIYL